MKFQVFYIEIVPSSHNFNKIHLKYTKIIKYMTKLDCLPQCCVYLDYIRGFIIEEKHLMNLDISISPSKIKP